MTPTIAAECIMGACVLAALILSEVCRSLRLRRVDAETAIAKASVHYWNELVDKEVAR